jgi:hypothetical protein
VDAHYKRPLAIAQHLLENLDQRPERPDLLTIAPIDDRFCHSLEHVRTLDPHGRSRTVLYGLTLLLTHFNFTKTAAFF